MPTRLKDIQSRAFRKLAPFLGEVRRWWRGQLSGKIKLLVRQVVDDKDMAAKIIEEVELRIHVQRRAITRALVLIIIGIELPIQILILIDHSSYPAIGNPMTDGVSLAAFLRKSRLEFFLSATLSGEKSTRWDAWPSA